MLQIHPLRDIPEILPGDDLAGHLKTSLANAGLLPLQKGDILIVTQKIVSKAEGRMVDMATVERGEAATELAAQMRKDPKLVELVLRESSGVVRAVPHIPAHIGLGWACEARTPDCAKSTDRALRRQSNPADCYLIATPTPPSVRAVLYLAKCMKTW
jgi:F420-0:gamma-glutamyl ligase